MIDTRTLPDGRVVIHYLNLLTPTEKAAPLWDRDGRRIMPTPYAIGIQRAHQIGGKKYRAKWYGGGIVFPPCNLAELEKKIKALVEKESR